MSYGFFAMISRMRLINRWSLMQNTWPENVQEHSLQVAVLAHALALLRQREFPQLQPQPDPEHVMACALFHDAGEIITGDMPTPIKYYTPELRAAYQAAETAAVDRLLELLPPALQPDYRRLLSPEDCQDEYGQVTLRLVKAADRLSAYIKCVEETARGNREFIPAKQQTLEKLRQMQLPEVDRFLQDFMPAFELSLDELQQPNPAQAES
ncbi:MAG: 5'-deoxynucleotidase [Oscillospiraceae bacterium]|nr:5'-deoxynucleotidase [Oscillospiraceae bacterium]MDD4368936.1 5'-deoxynucleotidase [Oscillospiraceae bacterium]